MACNTLNNMSPWAWLVSQLDPRKIKKRSLVNWLCGSVHFAWYADVSCLPISFWLAFRCAFIENTHCMKAVYAFKFASFQKVLNTKRGRLERFWKCLVQQKALLAMEDSAVIKIPGIALSILQPCPIYQTPFSLWFARAGSGALLH